MQRGRGKDEIADEENAKVENDGKWKRELVKVVCFYYIVSVSSKSRMGCQRVFQSEMEKGVGK